MFYSGEHRTILNLDDVARAEHAPDLSYLILFFRGGEMFTLRDQEAVRCAHQLAMRCHEQGDKEGGSLLRTFAAGVRETATVAGAGRR